MTSLFLWWQGYVTVRLRGPGLEHLLNKMTDLGIALTNVERLTGDVVIAKLMVRDFRRLRPLVRGSQISVTILDKHGAPFFLRKFKLRGFLVLGCLLSLLFVMYLSNFIWFIEVSGTYTLSNEAVKEAIEDLQLRAGIVRSALQPRTIEVELLKRFPDLAWVQVSIKGVKVEIILTEREGIELEQAGPGHVYAAMDGVITELLVLKGTPQVRDGSTVRKGELLISGQYYDQRGIQQFGAAQGVVKARVWYEGVGEAALARWEPRKTGRSHRQYLISIGPLRIPLGRSYPEGTHLRDSKEWSLSLGRALVPIHWSKVDYHEVEYIKVEVPRETAERNAYELAWESLQSQGVQAGQILEERTTVDFIPDADGIRVMVQVEVLEEIGQFMAY
ncbi:MAG: sporulation protein YqfD [Firmicutes bacterium]|nr:sporulation protein YqfD [Bacillota bacterium]